MQDWQQPGQELLTNSAGRIKPRGWTFPLEDVELITSVQTPSHGQTTMLPHSGKEEFVVSAAATLLAHEGGAAPICPYTEELL